MGFSTVLIISLAAGVVLIIGGGLMMYMSNLVKSAYDLKVQLKSDVDDRLNKIAEDLDKKSKWIKRDLLEEIEKIRSALNADTSRRFEELTTPLLQRLDNMENAIRNERAEWVKAVDADRATIAQIDAKLKTTLKKLKQAEEKAALPSPAPTEAESAAAASPQMEDAAANAATPAPGTPAAPAQPSAPASAPASRSGGPTPVGDLLQELGSA